MDFVWVYRDLDIYCWCYFFFFYLRVLLLFGSILNEGINVILEDFLVGIDFEWFECDSVCFYIF